jgi:hypothetical protein
MYKKTVFILSYIRNTLNQSSELLNVTADGTHMSLGVHTSFCSVIYSTTLQRISKTKNMPSPPPPTIQEEQPPKCVSNQNVRGHEQPHDIKHKSLHITRQTLSLESVTAQDQRLQLKSMQ